MKKMSILGVLMMIVINMMAQSSDAAYPIGAWQTDYEKDIYADLYIERKTEPDVEFGGKPGCGQLTIYNSKTSKYIYKGLLTYAGKVQETNGSFIYYFKVLSNQNKTSLIGVKKSPNDNPQKGNTMKAQIVKTTGELATNTTIKDVFYSVGNGNGHADPTPDVLTEKDLLETLEMALENGWKAEGFGNVRQFINAHAKLDPNKPKYVKCKSNSSVNIRQLPNAQATKVSELKPGSTLLVVDEYDGWCQVQLDEKQSGWISLSVVSLTNTPMTKATSQSFSTSMPSSTNIAGLIPSFFLDQNFFKTGWQMAPGYTDLARQGLKGNIRELTYNFTGKNSIEDFTSDIRRQITYNDKGMMTQEDITSNGYDYNGKTTSSSRRIQYKYNAQGKLVAIQSPDASETLSYNSQGALLISQGTKKMTYAYTPEGRLLSANGENALKLTYNKWGAVCQYDDYYTQKGSNPYVKPSTITYDVSGWVRTISICHLDGMDDIEYIEKVATFTYNEQGDIVKVVFTYWDCNSKWERKKSSYSESYAISYTYDNQGNWTKAIIRTLTNINAKRSITINREIKYW